MIRVTVKLETGMEEELMKLAEDANLDASEAMKRYSEKQRELNAAVMTELSLAYHRPQSLLLPRFPISHPYKTSSKWATVGDVAQKHMDELRADFLKAMNEPEDIDHA